MNTRYAERIYLVGPTGSGKSTVAAALARLLRWQLIDLDAQVEQTAGHSIAEIFAAEGEAGFREREHQALLAASTARNAVVATGGGIGERDENRRIMAETGWQVFLDASPEICLARLRAELSAEHVASRRPMLASGDPLDRMRALYERRLPWYQVADYTFATTALDAADVAHALVGRLITRGLLASDGASEYEMTIRSVRGKYPALVAWGGLSDLPERLRSLHLPGRLHLVTDAHVNAIFGKAIHDLLEQAGYDVRLMIVPAGEGSKSRQYLDAIHDWLADARAERNEGVIALGGGVIGDLAGFAAATYLRGMPLIHVPTSLLAQVDASIGGKVAIDHPRGKNLIGAFYPPRLVLTDPAVLLSLPERSLREGWAEVIKHGLALDASYFARIENHAGELERLDPRALTDIIAGSVSIKGAVVSADEQESDDGRRVLLNYGHTLGHAIETVTGYGRWLHGEAVAMGMTFAARLGVRHGVTPADVPARQEALLARFGLPTQLGGLDVDELVAAALWDKKVRGGRVRWILPTAVGAATVLDDVPESTVRAVLLELGAAAGSPSTA